MNKLDPQLQRLFRAAAAGKDETPAEMPFGFDTRVLAGWRAAGKQDPVVVGRLLRRVVLLSLGVILLAGAGVLRELRQDDDLGSPFADEYAIADNEIGSAFEQ
jgi:hypothetical protein